MFLDKNSSIFELDTSELKIVKKIIAIANKRVTLTLSFRANSTPANPHICTLNFVTILVVFNIPGYYALITTVFFDYSTHPYRSCGGIFRDF